MRDDRDQLLTAHAVATSYGCRPSDLLPDDDLDDDLRAALDLAAFEVFQSETKAAQEAADSREVARRKLRNLQG